MRRRQRDELEPPAEREDLGAAAVPVERLRAWYLAPETPAERASARRRVDELADDRWSVR